MEKKKVKLFIAIALITLALLVVGVTYAYFQNQYGSASNADVNVTTYTTDVLTFSTGDDINLEADQTTFGKDKGSVSGATYASALLTANNKTNTATANYYMYLNIENNTFTYSVQDNKPELIMTITDKEGNEVKNIEGLTYTEVTDRTNKKISGYDITTKSGLVTIFNNREIIAEPKAEDKWNITITFVNYEADQNGNAGKSMSAKVMIQKEMIQKDMIPLHESCNDNTLACHVAKLYTGTQGENNIYYHDSSLTNGAGDNSYRYAGGYYALTEAGKATGATMMIGYNNTVTTALIDFYCKGTKQYVGYFCLSSQAYYLIKGDTTQYQTYKETLNKAVEKGYLTKDNVKNFVCFGSNESPCPTDNLYRIIGVFGDQVKLIKYDYANSNLLGTDGDYSTETFLKSDYSTYKGELTTINRYYWNKSTHTNTWSDSNLNKVNLNKNFINNIRSEWSKKIAETTWKVGGNTWENISVPSVAYQNEITNAVTTNTTDGATEYIAKIGLMYASDYGFAASPSAWTSNFSDYDGEAIKIVNWMYMGLSEWTISRNANFSNHAFNVTDDGDVGYSPVYITIIGIRPSFNLSSSITYVSGSGSFNDPILIN